MIHGTKQDQILGQEFSVFLSEKLKKKFSFSTIQRIFGGASRETYRVVLKDEDQSSVSFIYRRSQNSSLIETSQKTEYFAYSDFQETEVPVPRLVALEESADVLGAPFMVMEELPGKVASPFDKDAYTPHETEIGQQFWKVLGKIAAHDVTNSKLKEISEEKILNNCWKEQLEYWVEVIRKDSLGVEPILEAAIRELQRSEPLSATRLSIVHGDYRNGNFLFEGKQITGILDWEMAHIGDPLEDLGWALSEIWCWEKKETPAYLIPREEALDIWTQESKIEINRDSLFWWELFACIKGLAIWISAGHEFSTGSNTDPVNLFSAWVPCDIHLEIILDKLESLV